MYVFTNIKGKIMIFTRKISANLKAWKANPKRKPLVLRGARQVGKTTLIKEFSKTYPYKILLNLEKIKDRLFFMLSDDVHLIINALFLEYNISSKERSKTLLFIDEIQEYPKAIQLLRYFYEELPELHVVAAGSLLEFSISDIKSFPVGRVQYLYMYPLNFQEYLVATNHDQAFQAFSTVPIPEYAHNVLLDLYNQYIIIGGMPEIVKMSIEGELSDLPMIYESIWESYKNDVEKYTSSTAERRVIKHIISTAHLYIDERIKFHNFGNSNYKSREVGEALRLLDDAKIIRLIYPTTSIQPPVKPDLKKSPRLQYLDTGLILHALGIQSQMLGVKDLHSIFKGAIIPHIVTQEIISLNSISNTKPNFWVREKTQSSAEVDLVYHYNTILVPIEIKSGKSGSLKSLHQFINRTNHPYAIRIYGGPLSIEHSTTPEGTEYILLNLPYFLSTKIHEYLNYMLDRFSANKPFDAG